MGSFANFFWPRPLRFLADGSAPNFGAVKVLTDFRVEVNLIELLSKLLILKKLFRFTLKTGTRVA